MKYLIGDAIIGCTKSILKNIERGLKVFPCLTWGDSLAIKYTSLKHMSQRLCEDINLNLINLFLKKINKYNILMSSKKKKVKVERPIDAIREMIEDQCLQISDLTEIVKKQNEEIRSLKAKWRAKESLEEEAKLEKEKADASSWFFASRSSD